MKNIIGRKKEIEELERLYNAENAEFVAVYGRRRVGKTYLIKEVFKDRFAFWHTGLSPYDHDKKFLLRDQLQAFLYSLQDFGYEGQACPKSWLEAFRWLEKLLAYKDDGSRQVIFIDELPWMDTARSRFIPAFEHFWNGWASKRDNILLIVCGSATSWMEDNLINNKGGLYNRLTREIKLCPFTLAECEAYFRNKEMNVSRTPIREALLRLAQENILQESGRGMVVIGISNDDMLDMYDIRLHLEGEVARRAARNITEEQLSQLYELTDLQRFYINKQGNGSSEHTKNLDSQFHELLYTASGSKSYTDVLVRIHKKMTKYRIASISKQSRALQSNEEHMAICEALASHDPDRAEQAVLAHVRNAMNRMEHLEPIDG